MKRARTRAGRPAWLLAAAMLLLAALPTGALAAESAPVSDAELEVDLIAGREGYSAVLYDNTNGLPTSEANAIAETEEGFIWIGSYAGLLRYDGSSFQRLDSTTGIASVVSLFVDSQDRLWVGTNDSGITLMTEGQFRTFSTADGLKASSVRAIAEDGEGNIYAATTHGVAVIAPDMTVHTLDEPEIEEVYVRDLKLGADGVLYGLTQTNEVFTLRDGALAGFYDHESLESSDVDAIFPDPENPGYVYFGTENSELYYGTLEEGLSHARMTDASPLTYIKCICEIDGQIWICADNGIGILEEEGLYQLENIPLSNSIDHVIADYQGNLWFTSSRQGVMKIVPNQFTDIFEKFALPDAVVNSTCRLEDLLFVGTDTGLTVLSSAGVVEHIPLTTAATASGTALEQEDLVEMLAGCRIRSILRDSRDRLWLSTWRNYGLLRYDHGALTSFTVEDGMPSDRIRAVCELQDGTIAAACTGGVAIIDGDRVARVYNEDDGIINTEILTVEEMKNGDLLAGSDGGGIYVIGAAGVTAIGTNEGLRSEVIMRLKRDLSRDVYWIITSNSIAYMNADLHVTTVEKFPYSNNYDLYENTQGEMWILSSNGIYVTNADTLLANGEIDPVYYGQENGLPCISTANSYSELTAAGELYIAGSTGVAKVNIEVPFEGVEDVKMAVPYVEADGIVIYAEEDGSITVPAGTKKLTIYSFVYAYTLMDPQVTYHLEGFDTGSTTVRRSELTPVDYTNLRGGSYRFILQLKDAMGRGDEELSVSITKIKAFYETAWFYALCAVAAAALIWLFVRTYTARKTRVLLEKQNEQRTFIREMTAAFARVIDMKDTYTNGHSTRVAEYTAMLTRELGYDEETVEKYYNIALLHDIGKIGVPAEVLNKQDKLTDEEYEIMKSHSTLGYNVLKDISIMPELPVGAGAHHERPDGRGYPRGLKGDEIPRVAQIIAVADTFDAMYSSRPYRGRMNFDKVVSIIRDAAGTQLTGDVVDAFLRIVDRGGFRAPDDDGGGATENIDNIERSADAPEDA